MHNKNIQTKNVESSKEPTQRRMTNFMLRDDVLKAEILWTTQRVMTKSSTRVFAESADCFPMMFTHSEIAQNVHIQKNKLSYAVTYGLGPYHQRELISGVSSCDVIRVSLDGAFNKVVHEGQMDLMIRYMKNREVHTRYLMSVFLEGKFLNTYRGTEFVEKNSQANKG
ncbi:hypothetical protein QAD02_012612 [Eretmocerus hayati]|uniref:Uncharacterized protein n=1 Tax=Eretmocerus hayati TaxID=131215 RepID=A0ACC2NZX9_9HYME|nr:hypothetical protein QAD02_012612 [Eretmocerus hayati]